MAPMTTVDTAFDTENLGVAPAATRAPLAPNQTLRLQELVDRYFDFAWRSLRRLGVPETSVNDAAQQLFLVLAAKLDVIDPGRERSFVFGTALRVASDWRHALRRERKRGSDDAEVLRDPLPGPDELLHHKRARELLESIARRAANGASHRFGARRGRGYDHVRNRSALRDPAGHRGVAVASSTELRARDARGAADQERRGRPTMIESDTRGPNDPERTLETLLRSMSGDAPSPSAKRATLAALGLGAAATTTAGAAGALGVAGTAKLLGVGALLGLAVTGVTVGIRHAVSQAPPNPTHAVAVRRAPPAVAQRSVPVSAPAPVPPATRGEPSELSSTRAAPVRTAPARSSSDPRPGSARGPDGNTSARDASPSVAQFDLPPRADSSLRDETAALDRARSAIAANDARAGLMALDRYDAAFPHGALSPEAELLRVKALAMTGDHLGAQALARAFIAKHPEAPHLEQLRPVLEP